MSASSAINLPKINVHYDSDSYKLNPPSPTKRKFSWPELPLQENLILTAKFDNKEAVYFSGEKLKINFSFYFNEDYEKEEEEIDIYEDLNHYLDSYVEPKEGESVTVTENINEEKSEEKTNDDDTEHTSLQLEEESEEENIVAASKIKERISSFSSEKQEENRSFVSNLLSWLVPSIVSPSKEEVLDFKVDVPLNHPDVSQNSGSDSETTSNSSVSDEHVIDSIDTNAEDSGNQSEDHEIELFNVKTDLDNSTPDKSVNNYTPSITSSAQPSFITTTSYLALAFVQVVGVLSVDNSFLKLSDLVDEVPDIPIPQSSKTKHLPVFSTLPTVLFGGLDLKKGEKYSYSFELILPTGLPPSYYGKTIRISYKVVLGIRKNVLDQPYYINLQFRVFGSYKNSGETLEYDLNNPFYLNKKEDAFVSSLNDKIKLGERTNFSKSIEGDILDKIRNDSISNRINNTYNLMDVNKGRTLRIINRMTENSTRGIFHFLIQANYVISNNGNKIATFHLQKTNFKIGESILCVLDFHSNCLHFSTFLEIEERINTKVFRRIVCYHQEFCLNMHRSVFSLYLLSNQTPEFSTSGFEIKWILRFEFVVSKDYTVKEKTLVKCKRFEQDVIEETPKKGWFSLGKTPQEESKAEIHYENLRPDIKVESFDCTVPIRVFGCEHEQGKMFPFRHRFVMLESEEETN